MLLTTPAMRRAGIFARSVPFTSVGQWQAARRRIQRGLRIDALILVANLALLAGLTLGHGAVTAWLGGDAALTPAVQAALMGLAGLAVGTAWRSGALLRSGSRLDRLMSPLNPLLAAETVAEIRARAPGLMRSLDHWAQATAVPLLQADLGLLTRGMTLDLFGIGHKAHRAQETPYELADAVRTLPWEAHGNGTMVDLPL